MDCKKTRLNGLVRSKKITQPTKPVLKGLSIHVPNQIGYRTEPAAHLFMYLHFSTELLLWMIFTYSHCNKSRRYRAVRSGRGNFCCADGKYSHGFWKDCCCEVTSGNYWIQTTVRVLLPVLQRYGNCGCRWSCGYSGSGSSYSGEWLAYTAYIHCRWRETTYLSWRSWSLMRSGCLRNSLGPS